MFCLSTDGVAAGPDADIAALDSGWEPSERPNIKGAEAAPSKGETEYVKVSNFTFINYEGFGGGSREFFKYAALWGFGGAFREDRVKDELCFTQLCLPHTDSRACGNKCTFLTNHIAIDRNGYVCF